MILILTISTCVVSWAGTRAALALAPRLGLMDVPNERSSHAVVTPRGGGLGIVVAAVLALIVVSLAATGDDRTTGLALLVAGVAAAGVGLLDDRRTVSPLVKTVGMAIALAVLVAAGLRIDAAVVPFFGTVELGVMAWPLSLIWLFGFANVFNFMDGIDGLTGGFTVVVGVFLGSWSLWRGDAFGATAAFVLAAAALGFLRYNAPPAKIFMGDVGSLFLGLLLAALVARAAGPHGSVPFAVSFLLLGAFLYDSAFTLVRRLCAGENVFRAHRSHLYQRLVIAGWSHRRVSSIYVGLTLCFGGLGTLWFRAGDALRAAVLAVGLLIMTALAITVGRNERRAGGAGC